MLRRQYKTVQKVKRFVLCFDGSFYVLNKIFCEVRVTAVIG